MTKRDGQQSNARSRRTRGPSPARVLLVADELAVGDRAAAGIEDRADRFEVTRAEDAAEGLSVVDRKAGRLRRQRLRPPGMDGVEFLRTVRERVGDLPFVLFTARGSEAIASEAVAAGVDEYLPVGGR